MNVRKKVNKIESLLFSLNKSSNKVELFQSYAPLLLLEKEIYYKEKVISIMKEAYGETEVVYADELSGDKIEEIFSGGGLFSSQRLLLIRQAEKIKKDAKSNLIPLLEKAILNGQATDAIFISSERKIASSLQSAITKSGNPIICWPLFDSKVLPWILENARKLGFRITPRGAENLRQKIGNDLMQLEYSMEIIFEYIKSISRDKSYVADEKTVENLFPMAGQSSIFEFLDDVFSGNFSRSVKKLHFLLDAGNHISMVITMIAKEVSNLYLAKELMKNGMTYKDMADRLSIKTMQRKNFFNRLNFFSVLFLKGLSGKLSQIDFLIKTSNISQSISDLEGLIFHIQSKIKRGPVR